MGTKQKTEYANQKTSTPTKIPSRQTKRFSMINKTLIMPRKKQVCQQNTKYDNQNPKYANQNTKYANQNLRCFVARQFLSQIYALFWRTFCRPKSMVAYQKGQISGMALPNKYIWVWIPFQIEIVQPRI